MNEKFKNRALALKVTRATEDRQFWVEGHSAKAGDFDHIYVSFSGYFGSYGPNMFVAAPQLLEALKLADAMLSGANMNKAVVERKVRAAISMATGKTSEAA